MVFIPAFQEDNSTLMDESLGNFRYLFFVIELACFLVTHFFVIVGGDIKRVFWFRKLESQPAKLLTASADDQNRKLIRGALTSRILKILIPDCESYLL